MKKVYFLHYSQLVQSNINATIVAFSIYTGKTVQQLALLAHQQGGSSLDKYQSEQEIQAMQQGCIYKYKIGQINDIQFFNLMNSAMGANLTFDAFKECWNAMCTISPKTKSSLYLLESMQREQDFLIHVLACTNKMHVEYINEQLEAAALYNLRIEYTFSFKAGTLQIQLPEDLYSKEYYQVVNLLAVRDDVIFDELKRLFAECDGDRLVASRLTLRT